MAEDPTVEPTDATVSEELPVEKLDEVAGGFGERYVAPAILKIPS